MVVVIEAGVGWAVGEGGHVISRFYATFNRQIFLLLFCIWACWVYGHVSLLGMLELVDVDVGAGGIELEHVGWRLE